MTILIFVTNSFFIRPKPKRKKKVYLLLNTYVKKILNITKKQSYPPAMGQVKPTYKSKKVKLTVSYFKKKLIVAITLLILIHTLKSDIFGSVTRQANHRRLTGKTSGKISISNDRETTRQKKIF